MQPATTGSVRSRRHHGSLLLGAAVGTLLLVGLALAAVDAITLGTYLVFAAIGGVLVYRRPRNAIGWLLIGIGFTFIGTTTPPGLDIAGLQAGTASLRDQAYAVVSAWAGGMSFLLYAALAMIFPSGRLPGGRRGRIGQVALVIGAVVIAYPALLTTLVFSLDGATEVAVPNPIGVLADPDPAMKPVIQALVTAIPISILAGGVVSLLIRYRRATGIEALQIRWLLASVALVVTSVIFGLVGFVASGMTNGLFWIPVLVAYPTVPLAIGVAVMRYRLFDIDRLVSRTISYGLITLILFVVFAAVNLSLQTALGSLVRGNAVAVAISTLAVAALFQPLRVRLQRAVDRRFNRSRTSHEDALAWFAAGLRDEVDVDRLLDRVASAAAETVEPTAVAVWHRAAGNAR